VSLGTLIFLLKIRCICYHLADKLLFIQFSKIHNTKMLFWVMLNCILVKTFISGEVITLIKDHSLTCVATQNSVIYISSRVPGKIHNLF
jgi:hypothetical protein